MRTRIAFPAAGPGVAELYCSVYWPRSSGVQVYSILTNNDGGTTFDDAGTSDIAPLTGGRSYTTLASSGTLESIAEEIAKNITVQYFVGYRTTNEAKDGKWRRIKVNVNNAPEEAGKLSVWTRSGYYAEKEKKPKGE